MTREIVKAAKFRGLSILTSSLAECVAEVIKCIDDNGQASVSINSDGVVKVRFSPISVKNDCGMKFNYDIHATPAQVLDDLTRAAAKISTYGIEKIAVDKVEIPRMNAAKVAAKEAALKTQERNVLECVPISKPWPIHSVINEMARKFQTRPERNFIAGTLGMLTERGLLRKNNAGEYQRVRREEADMKSASPVATVTPINPAADRVEKPQGTVMDRIAELSSEIRATSAQFATAFARLATKLDEIGMDAGQQAHISAEEAAKFRQFKELFRSL